MNSGMSSGGGYTGTITTSGEEKTIVGGLITSGYCQALPPQWNFCPSCGKKLESGWRYCSQCGQAIGTLGWYPNPYTWWTTPQTTIYPIPAGNDWSMGCP